MAESEKLTMNVNVVDLGQIDILVEQGFYSNRTDFIRTAIRNELRQHQGEIKEIAARKMMAFGVLDFDAKQLQEVLAEGRTLDIRVVGMLNLGPDVTPELARRAIRSVHVTGVFRASDAVKSALNGDNH